ncbi:PepSY domain-containing protein [Streptomyces acidicola]|uniref:PepSY domain-containing protein n=1 Tax=Streptomyces acidicola TaxID=2596892 RepID=A0A5N8X768_9ACTN|nr:PepSY domain-containing protein [Streptomyces acidicola]MPY54984.1 PepSY domain-containing protein [Streptomyces acidicola]
MKRNIVIATIAAVALVGAGTATALAVPGDDEAPAQRSSVRVQDDDTNGTDDRGNRDDRHDADDNTEDAAEARAAKVTAAEAIKAALREKSGTAVEAELESEGKNLVWEIDVLSSGNTWHTVHVDPGTGKVLGSHTEQEDADDADEARAALQNSSVSAAEAAEAVAAKGTVTSVELEDEGSGHGWDVDTTGTNGTESEWTVNLTTAKVTADRSSDDSDD